MTTIVCEQTGELVGVVTGGNKKTPPPWLATVTPIEDVGDEASRQLALRWLGKQGFRFFAPTYAIISDEPVKELKGKAVRRKRKVAV